MGSAQRHRRRPFNPERLSLLGGSALLGGLIVLGMGAPRNWWSNNIQLRFETSNGAGISPGMQVMIAGYPVGRVRQVRLLNNAHVQVSLSVGAEQAHMIGRRSRATLAQDNLLDKAYIAINPDVSDAAPAAHGAEMRTIGYEASPSLAVLVRKLAANRVPLEKVITSTATLVDQRLPRSLDQLDQTLISGQRLAGSVERELVGNSGNLQGRAGAAADNLERTLSSVQSTLNDIQDLARSSNALLQTISRSWLMQLLQPTSAPQPGNGDQLRNKRE